MAPRPRAARLRRRALPRRLAERDGRRRSLEAGAVPSTQVSWFAARAYCASLGKRLPTVDEWEYAAAASERRTDATDDAGVPLAICSRSTPASAEARTAAVARLRERLRRPRDARRRLGVDARLQLGRARRRLSRHGQRRRCAGPPPLLRLGGARRDGSRRLSRRSSATPCAPDSAPAPRLRPSASAAPRRWSHDPHVDASRLTGSRSSRCSCCCALATFGCASQRAHLARSGSAHRVDGDADRFSVYDLEGSWRDQSGAARSLASWRGTPVLLAMIYTHCTATCPLAVSELKRIAALDPDVRFVLVSLDPARDDPERLAALRRRTCARRRRAGRCSPAPTPMCAISPPRSAFATAASPPTISRTPTSSRSSTGKGASSGSRPDPWTTRRSPNCMRSPR